MVEEPHDIDLSTGKIKITIERGFDRRGSRFLHPDINDLLIML